MNSNLQCSLRIPDDLRKRLGNTDQDLRHMSTIDYSVRIKGGTKEHVMQVSLGFHCTTIAVGSYLILNYLAPLFTIPLSVLL